MTTILEIADKVTAKLNAASLSQTFEATRLYVPNFDLSDLKELRVTVVPREIDLLPLDRASNKVHAMIDVAVQKKFKKGDAGEIDPLVQFVEEDRRRVSSQTINGLPASSLRQSAEQRVVFSRALGAATTVHELADADI